jgi:hypothetical protein
MNSQFKPEIRAWMSIPGMLLQENVILALQTYQSQHGLYVLSLIYYVQDSKSSNINTGMNYFI